MPTQVKLHSRRQPAKNSRTKTMPPKQSEVWADHEHVAPTVRDHAQKLIAEAGSVELAKYAIDEAARTQTKKSARSTKRAAPPSART